MTGPLHLFLIDEDPVFRLGLKIWLEQQPGWVVVGEAATGADALAQLADLQDRSEALSQDTPADAAWADASPRVNGVILDLGLGQGDPAQLPGLQLCGDLKQRFPDLPVLVLSAQGDAVLQAATQAMGADGFGLRSLPVRELAQLIRQVVAPSVAFAAIAADPIAPPPEPPFRPKLPRPRQPLVAVTAILFTANCRGDRRRLKPSKPRPDRCMGRCWRADAGSCAPPAG
ncbi:MAG: response regulator transcription factor [Leptolyngbya sp. RL_3_1]|nr:response regulator transcription factor [Leptolyngbya sp. RL_3_1]